MQKFKFTIFSPGGNNTALVEPIITDPVLKKSVNDLIMAKNPGVEQVGFVDQDQLRLEMAGGEFCGNATRCATFSFLGGKPGSVLIRTSGVNQRLEAGVDDYGNVWTQMPVYPEAPRISILDGFYVMPLEGITQVVIYRKKKFSSPETAKTRATQILGWLKLDDSQKASGVIFTTRVNGLSIEPVVWVRDIKTLFFETACASGTMAVALVESLKNNSGVKNMSVTQPSGAKITASVELINNKFSSAEISGPIELLGQDTIYV